MSAEFENWRALVSASCRDRIHLRQQPWYPKFLAWALSEEGREILVRAAEFSPDNSQPAQQLVDKGLMRELDRTETIQAGDILHFGDGRAQVVEQHSIWVTNSLAQPPLEVARPMKVWRVK